MKTRLFRFCILFLLGLMACTTECPPEDMDLVQKFKPDDKYFKASLVALHFLIETSPVNEVDSIFNLLIEHHGLPVDGSEVKNGTYTGSSPYDAYDYRHEVEIEVKEGRIVWVDYNEVHKDGHGKQEDEAYCEEMSASGTTPAIAYPLMEEQLVLTQDMMQVDAVSGASYSLYRFRYALTVALMKALI